MASINMSDDNLAQLKTLIGQLSKNPTILNRSELGFFKSFIEQLGGSIPKDAPKSQSSPKSAENGEMKKEESPQPDLEEEDESEDDSDW